MAHCKDQRCVDGDVITRLCDCEILKDGKLVKEDLFIRKGRIANPEKLFFDEGRTADIAYDCKGLIVSPGFIDLQINGCFGFDFSSVDEAWPSRLKEAAQRLLQFGVTSFCPTIVTSDSFKYTEILKQLEVTIHSCDGANVLGAHLEGPFINEEKKGAHNEVFIRSSVSPREVERCYGSLDNVRIITLAPELPGAMETIEWLTEKGVIVSLGHSMCKLNTAEEAVKNGASFITHLFNAMLPFHHRDPGLVGLLTSLNIDGRKVFYGLISDNYHTHPTVTRIAHKANPHATVLVTDAMAAMGLPDGVHQLSDLFVDVFDGRAQLKGSSTLAGSVASMDMCMRTFKEATDCSTAAVLEAASLHPAEAVGISHLKGKLSYGHDADLVILDKELRVIATFLSGQLAWQDNENVFKQKTWTHRENQQSDS